MKRALAAGVLKRVTKLENRSWMTAFAHRTFSCGVRLAKLGTEIFLSCLEGLGAWSRDAVSG